MADNRAELFNNPLPPYQLNVPILYHQPFISSCLIHAFSLAIVRLMSDVRVTPGSPQLNPEAGEATNPGAIHTPSQINTQACTGFWLTSRLTSQAPAWENTLFLELTVLTSLLCFSSFLTCIRGCTEKHLIIHNIH